MIRRLVVVAVLGLLGCLELSLPPLPPPPGPGTIQGVVVMSVPGRTTTRAVIGAKVSLLGTTLSTVSNAEGRFLLAGVAVSEGKMLIAADTNGDGVDDRQRLIDLENIGAGPGRDIALGDVMLSRNATVVGRVVLGDNPTPVGHAGIIVFVPGAPFSTVSADTGDFVIESLPDGPTQLSFFRGGYSPENRELQARGGEEVRLASVTLAPTNQSSAPPLAQGQVFIEDRPASMARVQLVSPRTTVRTTTDVMGQFSVQASTADVFQMGIELDGAASLLINNVLLLPGTNNLGPITLAPGVSTPLFADAGTPSDGGAPQDGGPLVAVIDPPPVFSPGVMGVLSSQNSIGPRPLTSRWRSAPDGGPQLQLVTPDTTAPNVQFMPADAGRYEVTLQVEDGAGRTSPIVTATVLVGTPPNLVVLGPTLDVESGAPFLVQANATSTDGRPITNYRITQQAGPLATFPPMSATSMIQVIAPIVSTPTSLRIEVVAVTDIGLESTPEFASVRVIPAPPLVVAVDAGVDPVRVTAVPQRVDLRAVIAGGPPDASYDFDWNPKVFPCVAGPGCDVSFNLVDATTATPHFTVSGLSRDLTLSFTVTATERRDGGVSGTSPPQQVRLEDDLDPNCRFVQLSPLALRVECNEPVVTTANVVVTSPDGGTVNASPTVDGGWVTWVLPRPLSREPWNVSVQSVVTDRSGNPANVIIVPPTVPSLRETPTFESMETSETNPRPAWVALTAPEPGSMRRFVAARKTMGLNRMVWTMEAPVGCTSGCIATTQTFFSINDVGTEPGPSVAVTATSSRAYVLLSETNPTSVVEYSTGLWQEALVPLAPARVLGLAASANDLWVLTPGPLNVGLARQRLLSVDGGYSPAEVIHDTPHTFQQALLHFLPDGGPFAVGLNENDAVMTFEPAGGTSAWLGLPVGFPGNQKRVGVLPFVTLAPRLVTIDNEQPLLLFWRYEPGVPGWGTGVAANPVADTAAEFDVATFGTQGIVAWVKDFGELRLISVAPDGTFEHLLVPDGGVAWNNNPGAEPISFPRVVIDGDEVLLTWEVGVGNDFKMAAKTLK